MSLLDAVTDDLASLINRLNLEPTLCAPNTLPLSTVWHSLSNHGSTSTFKSPLTRTKRFRTTQVARCRWVSTVPASRLQSRLFVHTPRGRVLAPNWMCLKWGRRDPRVVMRTWSVSTSLPGKISTGTSCRLRRLTLPQFIRPTNAH